MKCIVLLEPTGREPQPYGQQEFDSRNAALKHLNEKAEQGEQFKYEIYEQVLEGETSVKLSSRMPTPSPALCEPAPE